MGKRSRDAAERLAALAFRGVAGALRAAPPGVAYTLADAATPLVAAGVLLRETRVARRGRGMLRNLRIAFRGADGASLERRDAARLLAGWARHLAWLAVDFCRMPRIVPGNLEQYVDTREIERLRPLYEEGRGVLCVSGHIGCWELLGHAATARGLPVSIIARPLPNAALDAEVAAIRRAGGQRVVPQQGALWRVVKRLGSGELVGLLADENAGARPVFSPFLGTLAATTRAPAFLHLVTGAPLAVVSCERTGRERFRIRVWRILRHAPGRSRERDLARVTAQLNEALGDAILSRPEQWLWGSRRFATRPPGEVVGPDGLPPRAAPGRARGRRA